MLIKEFIIDVLDQMHDLKSEKSKTNYLVQEIEFELGIVVNDNTRLQARGGGNLLGALKLAGEGEIERGNEMIHKVKIKLQPNKVRRTINNQNKQS